MPPFTLDAMILTRNGWRKHDEVQPGDETIGYNFATGRSEWTRIPAVHHYDDVPLVRIGGKRWHATVTPQHKWINLPRQHVPKESLPDKCPLCPWPDMPPLPPLPAVCPECGWVPKAPGGVPHHRRRKHGITGAKALGQREPFRRRGATTERGVQIHLARVHGIRASKQENQDATEASWVTTEDIRSRDRLLLSAVADTGPGLDITEQEAAILGWIAGDGHVERRCPDPEGCRQGGYKPGGTCRRHSARQNPSISIGQSKPIMVAKIDDLIQGIPHAHYSYPAAPSRVNKKRCPDRHAWRLDYNYAQDLIHRVGHPKDDAVRQILAMSAAQRGAWLEAFIDAEGHRNGEYVSVTQAHGPVLEAAHLAIYLCGYRPARRDVVRNEEHWSPTAVISAGRPIVSGTFLRKTDAGRGPVWCATTELGSWTAEQDGHVFLTG
jgi:hypothetical protein